MKLLLTLLTTLCLLATTAFAQGFLSTCGSRANFGPDGDVQWYNGGWAYKTTCKKRDGRPRTTILQLDRCYTISDGAIVRRMNGGMSAPCEINGGVISSAKFFIKCRRKDQVSYYYNDVLFDNAITNDDEYLAYYGMRGDMV